MIDTHGDLLDQDRLAMLEVGKTPYTEVMQILGSPSVRTIFGGEDWIYIYSQQKRMAFFKPEEFKRTITVLKFNSEGILNDIETKYLADGKRIAISPEKTRPDADSLSIIDQIKSNVGRFSQDTPVN